MRCSHPWAPRSRTQARAGRTPPDEDDDDDDIEDDDADDDNRDDYN